MTATPTPRHVTYVRLSAIRPATRNARTHSPDQIRHLRGLISRFGFTIPCMVDERTERLVAGHGRLEALGRMLADAEPAPAGILLDDDGEWLIPLLRGWTSTSDAEADALLIADNRISEEGDWHNRTLAAILEDVQAADTALFDVLGYSADDLDELLRWTTDASDVDPFEEAGDGMTGGPGDETGKKQVHCPMCGHHFTPGDRSV